MVSLRESFTFIFSGLKESSNKSSGCEKKSATSARLGPLPHFGAGGPPMLFTATIPADPTLCGIVWAAQGVVTGGFVDLSSAVQGVAGS